MFCTEPIIKRTLACKLDFPIIKQIYLNCCIEAKINRIVEIRLLNLSCSVLLPTKKSFFIYLGA